MEKSLGKWAGAWHCEETNQATAQLGFLGLQRRRYDTRLG